MPESSRNRKNSKHSQVRRKTNIKNRATSSKSRNEDEENLPKALRKNNATSTNSANTATKGNSKGKKKNKKAKWSDKHPKLSLFIKINFVIWSISNNIRTTIKIFFNTFLLANFSCSSLSLTFCVKVFDSWFSSIYPPYTTSLSYITNLSSEYNSLYS